MIIGIVGTLGAGKGTVVQYLIEEHGFSHYSSSDTLRAILTERGLPHTRLNLSTLAEELVGKYPGGILQLSYETAKNDGVNDFILEAIHRESEAEFVRSVGGKIIGVDAYTRVRFERSIKRQDGEKDNVTYEEFLQNSKREDDGKGAGTPNIKAVLELADVVIENSGTLEELHEQIEEALEKIKPS